MLRGVDQSVRRHDPVKARAPHPMMNLPGLLAEIDEFDAGPRRQEVVVGRLGPVTAVVEPIGVDVREELVFDLAGLRVAARPHARVAAAGDGGRPDQPADHQQVLRRVVPAAMMLAAPERPAGVGRKRRHVAVAAGKQDDVAVDDEIRHVAGVVQRPAADCLRLPAGLATLAIEADDCLAVVEVHAFFVHRQGPLGHGRSRSPEHVAAIGR